MKKILVPENITLHFGLKFSHLSNVLPKVQEALSNYAYEHLRNFAYELSPQFSVVAVSSQSDPLYGYENKLLAIDIKKVEDVALVHPMVTQEIQRIGKALLHSSPERLIVMAEPFKQKEFSLEIDNITLEMEIEARYHKLNKKIKAKPASKSHKI